MDREIELGLLNMSEKQLRHIEEDVRKIADKVGYTEPLSRAITSISNARDLIAEHRSSRVVRK